MEQHGYAGKILRVDLSSGRMMDMPTVDYANRFVGGRGVAAKIYWDEVPPEVGAFDPENRLIVMTGPMAGFPKLAGSNWTVCGKSPANMPEQFYHSHFGGSWGAHLKFAGYDGIVIQGKSDKPVYLLIQDDVAELKDASALWGKGTMEVREALKRELGRETKVVACGPAGENMVVFATLLAEDDSSGAGGFGAVMGSKKLKAIAVRGSKKVTAANPGNLGQITDYIRKATGGDPTLIFQLDLPWWPSGPKTKRIVCYGCNISYGCRRVAYEAVDGTKGKFQCGSANFYKDLSDEYYGRSDWEVAFQANKLCDNYGLDTTAVGALIRWLRKCNRASILTDENTGIPLSKIGSLEFVQTLTKKISFRDGLGDTLAQGLSRTAEVVNRGSKELLPERYGNSIHEGGPSTYPVLFYPIGLFYATQPMRAPRQQYSELSRFLGGWLRWANHEKGAYISSDVGRAMASKFWGSELAADFSTYEGKALAAKMIQDRTYASSSLILCFWLWPISIVRNSEDHAGDPALESKVISAVTGREMDELEFLRMGDAIFNLERAINTREGHRGRKSDVLPEDYFTSPIKTGFITHSQCLVPGKDGQVVSKAGAMLDRKEFEGMKDEYYQLRGWDVATGLQTRAGLEKLNLQDIAEELVQRGLIA